MNRSFAGCTATVDFFFHSGFHQVWGNRHTYPACDYSVNQLHDDLNPRDLWSSRLRLELMPMPLPLPRSITPGRCIVFLICLSLIVMLSVSSSDPEVEPLPHHDVQFVPRQDPSSPIIPSLPTSTPTPTSTTTSETTSRPNVVSSTTSQPSPTSTPQTPTSTPPPPTNTPTSQPPVVSSVESTGSDGSKTVIIVTVSASSSATTPTPSSPPKGEESSGLGTGSIIGLSVAGGIALLGIIAFFIWKFTRKHRSATYDDGKQRWWRHSTTCLVDADPPPFHQARSSGRTSIAKATLRGRATTRVSRAQLTVALCVTRVSEAHMAMVDWALRSLRSISTLQTRTQFHHFPI